MSFIDKLPFWFNKASNKELGASLGAIENELKLVLKDMQNLRTQYDRNTATSIWLDEHGDWYGIKRLPQEEDDAYRERMWREIIRSRLTIPSIVEEIESILPPGDSVVIKEPHNYIFKYNISDLSGEHIIPDGVYATHGVIDILITGAIPDSVYELAEELRAGGVKVFVSANGEIHTGPLPVYPVGVEMEESYHVLTEITCLKSSVDGFVLSESLFGDSGRLLSGGEASTEGLYEIIVESLTKWFRDPNSPTISYSPEYDVPKDITDYFNALLTERVVELTAPRRAFEILSDNLREIEMTLLGEFDFPVHELGNERIQESKTTRAATVVMEDTEMLLEIEYPPVSDKLTDLITDSIIEYKPVAMDRYMKAGSIMLIGDLLDKTTNDLDPLLPSILVEVTKV